MNRFAGVFLPVTTPFDPVTGEIAPVAFRQNLRRWLAAPVDGIVLFGSTGEGVLLDLEERQRLIGFARDLVPPGTPLVVGAGAESTRATIRLVRALADAGAEAALVAPPAYFGSTLTPAALRDHFRAVADAAPIPILVYHIPKFTHVTLDAGLVGELARHPNIAGLKDSSGDIKRFADYSSACAGECSLFIGSGALFYTALELGAAGGIVALGLLAAEGCAAILRHFRAGETREAGEIQTRLAPVHREVVARYGAAGAKAALDLLGYIGGRTRPPLGELDEKQRRQVARVLQDAKLI
ncbi:MAG TPA: dihydrodipicolinate synthase family protein [Longimicrobiales bacterium]